ncbi:DUF397 domain-containing protein [Micromonospora thermarum]|uniref:DUF397 domain-containing protein n=1 Tax=Micromonospora thermarum TaxID=2720024 RepID=A0ABX0Z3T9_9ACTN|nr:DUF397 domain-containing protein [Micromonospora thermarum]NJP30743.1 DUF397 domain-containing protein [Micromonospora thermarum]
MDDSKFTRWYKSTRSSGGDNCVEVAIAADGTVGVRDSKDPTGGILEFGSAAWAGFVAEIVGESGS